MFQDSPEVADSAAAVENEGFFLSVLRHNPFGTRGLESYKP